MRTPTIEAYHADALDKLTELLYADVEIDLIIADPPYGEHAFINDLITKCRSYFACPSLFFMYPEDLCYLDDPPDQVLHWIKPISTKNTAKRYSRFVEAIAYYEKGEYAPDNVTPFFNQDLYWANRSGIFTDILTEKPIHPYQKPVSLIERLILLHTPLTITGSDGHKRFATVLDPCAGSGTTGIAARNTNRSVILIEKEQLWYNVLRDRLK